MTDRDNRKEVRVLVVDDDSSIQILMRKVMELIGVQDIVIASNGSTGFDKFEEYEPDIIFTDYLMPKIDGVRLLNNIKAVNPEVIVVLYTGNYKKLLNDTLIGEEFVPNYILQKPLVTVENIFEIMEVNFPEQQFRRKYNANIERIIKESEGKN